jgi:hypothetical protein
LVIIAVVLFVPGGVLGLVQTKFKAFGAGKPAKAAKGSLETEI